MKILAICLLFLSISCFAQEKAESPALSEGDTSLQKDEKKLKRKKKKNKKDTSNIIHQTLRLEIPLDDRNDEIEVVEGYDNALLVIQNTKESNENGIEWKFYQINKDLEKDWELDEDISSADRLIGYDYNSGYYFLLFENEEKYLQYKLMVIDRTGEKTLFREFKLAFEVNLLYLEALDKGILLVGTHNFRPVAMIYDIISGTPVVLPGFYNRNERVFDLVMDDTNRSFSIVLTERMKNGKYTNRVKVFTYSGLLIQENIINPGENLNLVDGKTTNFGNGVLYMAGTYSIRPSLFSRGIYISKFTNGSQQFIKSYNYGDLENFFTYRGERVASRIQRRVSRKRAKGKEPKFGFQLYIHDIVQKGDLNILIAEAYYARYGSSPTPGFVQSGPSGSPFSYSGPFGSGGALAGHRLFLGYKFTHSIIMAFNSRGEIVWDNSFKTNDITSYSLEESVAVNVQDDRAAIMYLDDNLIKSKVVEGSEVVEEKTYNPVRLLHPGDDVKSRSSRVNGIESWYDNYLYSFGVQRIENKNYSNNYPLNKRRVFYINKIQFDSGVSNSGDFRISSAE